ncbi:hypothetical protein KY290_015649 [Solanum tuberosum]|uniref:Uncharacterized protein n=1 Tax=Solanum tuberosum TaxID=4113 RepID=A0ABQ7VT56_SOLTU|nr:hypothetical protein KY290_015649 [Solanum tuberosum]
MLELSSAAATPRRWGLAGRCCSLLQSMLADRRSPVGVASCASLPSWEEREKVKGKGGGTKPTAGTRRLASPATLAGEERNR